MLFLNSLMGIGHLLFIFRILNANPNNPGRPPPQDLGSIDVYTSPGDFQLMGALGVCWISPNSRFITGIRTSAKFLIRLIKRIQLRGCTRARGESRLICIMVFARLHCER